MEEGVTICQGAGWMTLKAEMMPHLIREHEKVGRTLTEDDQSPRDKFSARPIAYALPPLPVTEKFPDQFSHLLDVFIFRQTRQHVLAALFGNL